MDVGYRKIFWGFILTMIHINMEQINIFPPFIGFLVIYYGINHINKSSNQKEFALSSHICFVTIIYSVIMYILTIFWKDYTLTSLFILMAMAVSSILNILLIFYIFTGSIKVLEERNLSVLSSYYSKSIRIYILIYSLISVIEIISVSLESVTAAGSFAIVGFLLNIWLLIKIHGLKKIEMYEQVSPEGL